MSNDALHTTGLTRRAFIGGALATGAALAMAGTNTQLAMADEPQAGGVLNYYITNPVAIEPFGAEENQGVEVMFNTFDPLCVFDWDKGEVVGLTAESWDVNDAADEFTFHIRPEAKFHNGQPVTSKDFKYAWERLVNANFKPQPSSLGYKLAQVQGADEMMNGTGTELAVECPDDLTFVVHLKAPFADFASIACERALAPVPAGCTDTEEDFQKFRVAPIGNGPFMMDGEWADGQYISLKPFADYWGEKPLLDGINFQILSSDDTAWLEYQAGNLDFLMVAAGHFNEARQMYGDAEDDGYLANPGHQYIWGDETSIYYLICNNEDEVMSNRDLRIAISYAVDRQAICDTALQGTRSPATNMLAVGVPGSVEGGWIYTSPTKDVDKANEYFDKAGYPSNADGKRDLTLTFSSNTGSSNEQVRPDGHGRPRGLRRDLRAQPPGMGRLHRLPAVDGLPDRPSGLDHPGPLRRRRAPAAVLHRLGRQQLGLQQPRLRRRPRLRPHRGRLRRAHQGLPGRQRHRGRGHAGHPHVQLLPHLPDLGPCEQLLLQPLRLHHHDQVLALLKQSSELQDFIQNALSTVVIASYPVRPR